MDQPLNVILAIRGEVSHGILGSELKSIKYILVMTGPTIYKRRPTCMYLAQQLA